MVALRKLPPSRMSFTEFLDWNPDDGAGLRWQLIDGEPVAMAPATQRHGAIQSELGALLRNHLLAEGSPCRVIAEPGIVPRVRADRNFRIPDLGVTCAAADDTLMVSDPVLLIEVLSPNNEAESRAAVWAYTTLPSVREILVVNSTRIEAELLRRRADASWPEDPEIVGPDGTLTLASIDYAAALTALYRTTSLAV